MAIYRIFHNYDIGDRSVFIESDTNPTDAAAYLQFKAEELSGDDGICLSNLAIAHGLVVLYGCTSGHNTDEAIPLDMYEVRESRCGNWYINNVEQSSNPNLVRAEKDIRLVLQPHFSDQ